MKTVIRKLFGKTSYNLKLKEYNMAASDEIKAAADKISAAAATLSGIQLPAPPDFTPVTQAADALAAAVEGLKAKIAAAAEA